MNKRMYFLNVLLIFSHEPIVQVCLMFVSPPHPQTLNRHTTASCENSVSYEYKVELRLFVVHIALAQVILSS